MVMIDSNLLLETPCLIPEIFVDFRVWKSTNDTWKCSKCKPIGTELIGPTSMDT